MTIPAKIGTKGVVAIYPKLEGRIENAIECKYNIPDRVLKALQFLSTSPRFFPLDPRFDPLEKIVTPGAGESFQNSVMDAAGINNPESRQRCNKMLGDCIIPAHESNGHIKAALSAEKGSFEFKMSWLAVERSEGSATFEEFIEFLDHMDEETLHEHYILSSAHELYAMLHEAEAWKSFEQQKDMDLNALKLKRTINSKRSILDIGLLRFLEEKSGGDLRRVRDDIDQGVSKLKRGFSTITYRYLTELANGIDIDNALDSTINKFAEEWNTTENFERGMQQRQQLHTRMYSLPIFRAAMSTYLSLSYSDSQIVFSFYSEENSGYSVLGIPMIVIAQEAKRILENSDQQYPISPLQSIERQKKMVLEEIASGKFKQERKVPIYKSDVLADLHQFYNAWRPAMLLAQQKIGWSY